MGQSHLKELMIAQAGEAFVLADHSKLGRAPFAHCTAFDRPYTLITDSGATARSSSEFRDEHAVPTWSSPISTVARLRHG